MALRMKQLYPNVHHRALINVSDAAEEAAVRINIELRQPESEIDMAKLESDAQILEAHANNLLALVQEARRGNLIEGADPNAAKPAQPWRIIRYD